MSAITISREAGSLGDWISGRHPGENTQTGLPTTRELVTDPVMLDAVRYALQVLEA